MTESPRLLWCVTLCSLLVGCATQGDTAPPLPFHLALMPVEVELSQVVTPLEGSPTEIVLSFDDEPLSEALMEAIAGRFSKITLLSAPLEESSVEERERVWLNEAQETGADLILGATLTYQEAITTELNDSFWLNLPLFALGGPATWFVSDRSYYVDVRLEAELYDVAAAAKSGLTLSSRVLLLDRQLEEAPLNFLDRSGDLGHFALALLVPAGFIAPESDEIPAELQEAISRELCEALVQEIQSRSPNITVSQLVAFYPEGVHTTEGVDGRYLEGEVVLELGQVTELGSLRYRLDSGGFVDATLTDAGREPASGRRDPLRRYRFQIPLGDTDADTVQLEVRQSDRTSKSRTFTYPIRDPQKDRSP